ncbi:MAG: NDP-sugar synthase, partial [Chloroflexi bacterium]|nr:NDP-sugar synthase [Chloroflexota bacterium]
MKAVVLVGGSGTRLRPLTTPIPKPMLPVVNRPFLEHVIEHLKQYGLDDIVLLVCYRHEVIQEYFGDGRDRGVAITYVVEEKGPLGTAGAVKNAESLLTETFVVCNGDILTDLNLEVMMAFHREKQARATISLAPVDDPTAYGLVQLADGRRVERFVEKPSWDEVTTNLINAGTYILEPGVLRYVPPETRFLFERGLFPMLLQVGNSVYGYPSTAYWLDIGTPDDYLRAHRDILTGQIDVNIPGRREGDVWLGDDVRIDPTARIRGPAVIGNGCVIGPQVRINGPAAIGDGCHLDEGTFIEDAVLWQRVTVARQVVLRHCVIANDCTLGDNVLVTDSSLVGAGCTIGEGNRLERGLQLGPGRTLEP